MKPSTRKMLEDAAVWGKRNAGHGYSTARLIREALANEDNSGIDPHDNEPDRVLDLIADAYNEEGPRYPRSTASQVAIGQVLDNLKAAIVDRTDYSPICFLPKEEKEALDFGEAIDPNASHNRRERLNTGCANTSTSSTK